MSRSRLMTRLDRVMPISTRQLALRQCIVTLLVVQTQSWVQGQDQTWPLASITLTSANSLVTTRGPPSTTKNLRSVSPTSRLMGSGPQRALSVVSGTTPSQLGAAWLQLLLTLIPINLVLTLPLAGVVAHLLCLIVAHLNLAAVPSPSTKPCSMTKLRSCKQR